MYSFFLNNLPTVVNRIAFQKYYFAHIKHLTKTQISHQLWYTQHHGNLVSIAGVNPWLWAGYYVINQYYINAQSVNDGRFIMLILHYVSITIVCKSITSFCIRNTSEPQVQRNQLCQHVVSWCWKPQTELPVVTIMAHYILRSCCSTYYMDYCYEIVFKIIFFDVLLILSTLEGSRM